MSSDSQQPPSGSVGMSGGKAYSPVVGANTGTINVDQKIIQEAAKAAVTALHSIPDPPSDFQGRDKEIDQLVAQLKQASANGSAAAISGVRGLGGIGKSALAFKVAQALRSAFPDAQIMLALRGATKTPMSSEEALREVLRAFGQDADPSLTLDQLKANYRSILTGKRALILADDAKDTAHVAPLLPPSGCALLITSRVFVQLPGMPEPLALEKLPEPDAVTLARTICARISEAVAKQLATLCGRLPLAIRISASYLARPNRSIESYLRDLADERQRLAKLRDKSANLDVEASFNLSYNALEPAAQAALRRLGVFAASFNRLAVENVVTLPDGVSHDDALNQLYDAGLLDYDEATDRYDLHDLVRVFALSTLREANEEEMLRLRYAEFFAQIARRADQLYKQGNEHITQGLALFDAERAHIDAAWTWLREQPPSERIDHLLMRYADATVYVGDLRYNKRTERIPQLEAALAAARRQQDKAAEGRFLGNLGIAYRNLGEVRRAIAFYEQRLTIAREIGDRHGEGNALGNLGLAYADLGEVRRAIAFYEQHLAIAREIGDRQGEANSSWNLGRLLAQQGDVARGCALMQVLVDYEREIGHPDAERRAAQLANAYNDLGDAHNTAGDQAAALAAFDRAIELQPDFAMWHRNRAHTLIELGRLDDARNAIDRARALEPEATRLAELEAELEAAQGEDAG